ncbi:MAG: cytochrome c family protein [Flavobacteriales bacterium CG18_big_fil_WC_8_21_14_2_50_32_9]|nr:MAG: cytochrome c family protein [Flavobacteriales bacterium CG18_big_fil_WC_8_21_14_2_50_32_9]PIZ05872.1 MAG: cytochrome c family protein [Flavobacteriales bacterium CG_4_10_14_0_8_um_filter_32_5]PJC62480.1 MAG: cytochrome c family protein [Flavobacteriales bacterium CG_4_9_14_0_2_um_filter_32_27]
MKTLNKITALSILFSGLLLSCSEVEKQTEEDNLLTINNQSVNEDNALTLLKTNCFTCHNPNLEIEKRIAPPWFKVRQHYYDDETSKEDFIAAISNFINNPTEENSIMPGAVRNFGLMPKMSFKEGDLKIIASYLYDNDISSDEWYEKWEAFEKKSALIPIEINYEDLGRNIANETKANLGKNLMAAVKEKGAAGAVDFCNIRAIPITDSMSVVLNAKVKRVSDKPRNSINAANEDELEYIENWKKAKEQGEKYPPKVVELNNKMVGYYPIETNEMCMKCHGIPEKQINTKTLANIKKLYPNDKATGYSENEIRGIFVVVMDKK